VTLYVNLLLEEMPMIADQIEKRLTYFELMGEVAIDWEYKRINFSVESSFLRLNLIQFLSDLTEHLFDTSLVALIAIDALSNNNKEVKVNSFVTKV